MEFEIRISRDYWLWFEQFVLPTCLEPAITLFGSLRDDKSGKVKNTDDTVK